MTQKWRFCSPVMPDLIPAEDGIFDWHPGTKDFEKDLDSGFGPE